MPIQIFPSCCRLRAAFSVMRMSPIGNVRTRPKAVV
jgi:hypothetical protein